MPTTKPKPLNLLALLRGINVGGKNKLPMKDLQAIFLEAGCSEVSTFIQSGNVLCNASVKVSQKLAVTVEAAIRKQFGYTIPIVLRSADEMRGVLKQNPFVGAQYDSEKRFVMFLGKEPTAERAALLDAQRSPGDRMELRGRDLYLYLPNGVAKTKITNAYLDSKLQTVSTGRNWRTVQKLVDLMA